MGPICPNCGSDDNEFCTAWDSGFPDYAPGSLCNDCGAFVRNGEWEYEDDDQDEIALPDFGASADDILDDLPPEGTLGLTGMDAYYAYEDDHPCCQNCGERLNTEDGCHCDNPMGPDDDRAGRES